MMSLNELEAVRREVAEREWDAFHFGNAVVEEADGWQSTIPGDSLTRVVFFENSDEPGGDSVDGFFTVMFDGINSTQPICVYAVMGRHDVGRRGNAGER